MKKGVIQSKRKMTTSQKYLAKEIQAYIFMGYVISREILLHYFGGLAASYL